MAPRKTRKPAKRSLSANLERSADKRGLTGQARDRYIIGGAIRAEKMHEAKLARGKVVKTAARAASRAPAKKASPGRLELIVRRNAEASAARNYDVYSLYRPGEKTPYSSATYRKRSAADQARKVEIERHHNRLGVVLEQRHLA